MGCRIDGQTGMQRETRESGEERRCRAEAAAATKYLSFLLRVSPLVRPSVLESSEAVAAREGGREEDNGELSCRINFVGL